MQTAREAAEAMGRAEQAPYYLPDEAALGPMLDGAVNESTHELQATADAAVAEQIGKLKVAGRLALDGHVPSALHEQELVLGRMLPEMEAGLEKVRQALAAAKAEKALQAGGAAASAAEEVHSAAVQRFAALGQVGDSMTSEAEAMLANISGARASIVSSDQRARALDGTVAAGVSSLEQALLSSVPSAGQLEEQAEEAERTAGIIDAEAAHVLAILSEASRHAANASEIALQAVHQATQNALKLKTVQTLVEQTTKAAADAATAAAATTPVGPPVGR